MIKINPVSLLAASALTLLLCTGAQADATLNFSGKLVAPACTVGSTLAAGQNVDLGSTGRVQLQHANQAGEWQEFDLVLTNCPTGTTKSTVTFTGTPDGVNDTLFANAEPTDTAATHVAVQMAERGNLSNVLSNGSTLEKNVDSTAKTVTFPLAARLYTPDGGARAGKVKATVLVNFTYQ
ncbi:fimbrial protein [Enterobacillus tribolii]|uniref:Minor fimbrial subunit n=1 Tax=Enterobacillus tribolii TaxID=1487935 RepID=A0A370QNW5_9GAMM|nr:fimbrial protein [Enterobacillus tribolii]MBW7981904.1 type 1 fimbrial protein [Enterobacillus tribolii]RDK90075.1 minor fimbrial subunit [Enterobacillus tribolii]